MIFGAILAGGVGSRMNIESMPKQFLPLGEKPVFLHTVEKFLMCSDFDAIYVGTHRDWTTYAEDVIAENVTSEIPVKVVSGGADRNGTIMEIIAAIEKDYGVSDGHIIVTHDSVRPFVKLSTIKNNIAAMATCDACDTVIPATDTIVESKDSEFISSIPLRSELYQGQTPQSFRMNVLKEVYEGLTDDERAVLTDACKMFIMKGRPVSLVEGDATNIKLTTIMDYKVAQALIDAEASLL